jgi:hypothetical protein
MAQQLSAAGAVSNQMYCQHRMHVFCGTKLFLGTYGLSLGAYCVYASSGLLLILLCRKKVYVGASTTDIHSKHSPL